MKNNIYTICLGVLIMSLFNCNAAEKPAVRRAAVANRFYTGNPVELKKEIEQYLGAGSKMKEHPQIIISPHAGYIFSGAIAGLGFAAVDRSVQKVILIGPSHTKYFDGVSIPEVDFYETPLGKLPLNKEMIKKLRKNDFVHSHSDAHSQEHCLEVQLPFLQVILSDFSIVPIIVSSGFENFTAFAEVIYPLIDEKTLVVISSDFSHFFTHEKAQKIDKESIETILQEKLKGPLDACGENPIRIAMHLSKKMGLKPCLIEAKNSYETAPPQAKDQNRVVGYASIVYLQGENCSAGKTSPDKTEKPDRKAASQNRLSDTDQAFMLKLARDALNRAVNGKKPPDPKDIPAIGQELCGCFVTLTKHGSLRGCIGYIEGIKPLFQAVIDNAKNAALGDPRFPNVSPDELDAIKVEVSVLTKPESFTYTDTDDLLSKIIPAIDGIILKKGMRQSTFLPQVWDQLPDKVTFLEHLAMKAGLARDEWKDAEYKKYQAIHFEEE